MGGFRHPMTPVEAAERHLSETVEKHHLLPVLPTDINKARRRKLTTFYLRELKSAIADLCANGEGEAASHYESAVESLEMAGRVQDR